MHIYREAAESVQQILSLLKTSQPQTWYWALEELLEIHAQTIVPLDSMMVPDDYLQKGKIVFSDVNTWSVRLINRRNVCALDYELCMIIKGGYSNDNVKYYIVKNSIVFDIIGTANLFLGQFASMWHAY
jgi:hypothetical protein